MNECNFLKPGSAVICQLQHKNPVDTGRKLNVHKTSTRCSGHLLNVLYTFDLRPVPTGKEYRFNVSDVYKFNHLNALVFLSRKWCDPRILSLN